eukprot:2717963-Pleurochrysis_carterae.AAC.1
MEPRILNFVPASTMNDRAALQRARQLALCAATTRPPTTLRARTTRSPITSRSAARPLTTLFAR